MFVQVEQNWIKLLYLWPLGGTNVTRVCSIFQTDERVTESPHHLPHFQ